MEGGECRLVSRNRNAFKTFPALSAAIAAAVPHQAVIDGEIVRLGSDGRPQFYELMRRHGPMSFCAFDLLFLDGEDLRARSLLERKKMLRKIVRPPLLYVDHVAGEGVELFRMVCERDLEGIVAKLAAGCYDPANTSWVKIKNPSYSQAEGRREFFDRQRR